MGRTVRIRERRGPQFKLESLAVYDSEGAVAVVQLQQELMACGELCQLRQLFLCITPLFPERP